MFDRATLACSIFQSCLAKPVVRKCQTEKDVHEILDLCMGDAPTPVVHPGACAALVGMRSDHYADAVEEIAMLTFVASKAQVESICGTILELVNAVPGKVELVCAVKVTSSDEASFKTRLPAGPLEDDLARELEKVDHKLSSSSMQGSLKTTWKTDTYLGKVIQIDAKLGCFYAMLSLVKLCSSKLAS